MNVLNFREALSFVITLKTSIMPREAEPSSNERAFVLQALKENIRVDGRAFDAFRDMTLTFGDEPGVVDLKLGNTRWVRFRGLSRLSDLICLQSSYSYLCRSDTTISRPKI